MKSSDNMLLKIIKRIIFICIVLVFMIVVGVKASKNSMINVTISFPDDNYETSVITSKIKVKDILSENRIIVLPDEKVFPDFDSNIDFTRKIVISRKEIETVIVAEEVENVSIEEILGNYVTVTEKIIIEQIEIPFETVTKDVSLAGTETKDTILQEGRNGLKELKYKVKFQDDVEIERNLISEEILREPVDKIIQISTKVSYRGRNRVKYSPETLQASVEGMTPQVVNLNTSAYCPCIKCCGKTNGITSSGAQASEWYTIAAGPGYPMGTIIYIPALSNKPNGGWFVVEDRGGAITNNRIDIFMGSHSDAIVYGRRNLQCYIY